MQVLSSGRFQSHASAASLNKAVSLVSPVPIIKDGHMSTPHGRKQYWLQKADIALLVNLGFNRSDHFFTSVDTFRLARAD